MKAYRLAAAGLALGLLTGCASLLERSYTTSEPHSSKFWESEAAATLRAENRQDMVNDLLILIGQHTETASLRLYNFPDEQTALEELEKAAQEVQQETPLGAYAVEYITYISQPQRSCFEADLQIGYRRTAEQMQTIVSASSVSALGDLLEAALDGGRTELVVRMGYWQADGRRWRRRFSRCGRSGGPGRKRSGSSITIRKPTRWGSLNSCSSPRRKKFRRIKQNRRLRCSRMFRLGWRHLQQNRRRDRLFERH